MPQRRNQEQHDRTIEYLAMALASNRYLDVRADLPISQKPAPLSAAEEVVPDLTASKNGINYLFEVETEDTLQAEDSRHQWQVMSDYARQNGGRFILVVPPGLGEVARSQVQSLQIQAEIWSA